MSLLNQVPFIPCVNGSCPACLAAEEIRRTSGDDALSIAERRSRIAELAGLIDLLTGVFYPEGGTYADQ